MPQKHGKKATGKREENLTRLSYPEREQARSKIKEKVLHPYSFKSIMILKNLYRWHRKTPRCCEAFYYVCSEEMGGNALFGVFEVLDGVKLAREEVCDIKY